MAHPKDGFAAEKVIALGLGTKPQWPLETLRRAGGRLARKAREIRVEEALIEWPRHFKAEQIKAFAEGLILGSYQYTRYKTQLKDAAQGNREINF